MALIRSRRLYYLYHLMSYTEKQLSAEISDCQGKVKSVSKLGGQRKTIAIDWRRVGLELIYNNQGPIPEPASGTKPALPSECQSKEGERNGHQ